MYLIIRNELKIKQYFLASFTSCIAYLEEILIYISEQQNTTVAAIIISPRTLSSAITCRLTLTVTCRGRSPRQVIGPFRKFKSCSSCKNVWLLLVLRSFITLKRWPHKRHADITYTYLKERKKLCLPFSTRCGNNIETGYFCIIYNFSCENF